MPGIIESYIHTGSQTGVLVEINCKNKVTATTSEFKTLAKEIALQIATDPQVIYIETKDIPSSIVRQIERQIAKENDKQELLRQKIKKMCLYEQPYIRDDSITVEDLIKLHIAQLSESIKVNRFARFIIDESNSNPPEDSGGIPINPSPKPDPSTKKTQSD